VFLALCKDEGVALAGASVLEIGCGTGFYTEILRRQGARAYVGLDITDALFSELRKKYPDFVFEKGDITRAAPNGRYDIVLMIDVTQHIVEDRRFFTAMENVKAALKPGGVFIVTSWLTPERIQRQPHEVARPLEAYRQAFPDAAFSDPRPFRDKNILVIRPRSHP